MARRVPRELSEVLERLDRGLTGLYGDRYKGMVLFGSYARGDADKGSDVDLLLLLEGEVDGWREVLRAEPVKWPLSLDSGYVLALMPVSVEAYREARKPLLMNARREGILVP